MIKLHDAAIALHQAGFNVELPSSHQVTVGLKAIKNGYELNFSVINSTIKFNSCNELVTHCERKVSRVKRSWFDTFRNERNIFR